MGRNTAVLLLNDAIPWIRDNPEKFADSLMDAFDKFSLDHSKPVPFRVGNLGHGGYVFHEAHADQVGVYAIGGNTTEKMYLGFANLAYKLERPQDKLTLLEKMAEELGYELKPKSKISARKHRLSGTVGDALGIKDEQ